MSQMYLCRYKYGYVNTIDPDQPQWPLALIKCLIYTTLFDYSTLWKKL